MPGCADIFRVDFVTNNPGGKIDPSGVLPTDWESATGFTGVPSLFKGSWFYNLDTVDQNPTPRKGEFRFTDPNLRIHINAAGLCFEFQLDRITFTYSDSQGDWNWFTVFGSRNSSNFRGITFESVEIKFGSQSVLPSAIIPSVDTPHPIPGSPWEDGSGVSELKISGTNGLSGSEEIAYTIGKVLGKYTDSVAL